ncbi:MAG: hypothetical protein Q4G27_04640 [Flavobacteriaceae bacterium]|nr:hypothetical protein [Flavobacteriaceae bacterium]
MIIPKLFRWLFFRKKLIYNTFDALRNKDTVYIDTSLNLDSIQDSWPGSLKLKPVDLPNFKNTYSAENAIIIFGNNEKSRNEMHDLLERNGFSHVFNVGTLQELIIAKNQINA